jgi:SAM-dependent methyltransferase
VVQKAVEDSGMRITIQMNLFQGKLAKYSAGRVLDFGTGSGASVKAIIDAVKDFKSIIGIDQIEPEQEVAPDLLNAPYFQYIQHDGPRLPFKDNFFDTVCMSHVLHHLSPDLRQESLTELKRVLKPGGHFLFVESYRDQQLGARKTQIYFHFLRAVMDLDKGIHHYQTPFREELIGLVRSMGFRHCDVFDFAPMREDYRDRANIEKIVRFIDQKIAKAAYLPKYTRYLQFGELLKRRMYRTGYCRMPSLRVG